KALAIHDVAEAIREARAHDGKVLFVLGPAVVHTAARRHVADLVRRGYIQGIFGGNAGGAHDGGAGRVGTCRGDDPAGGRRGGRGGRSWARATGWGGEGRWRRRTGAACWATASWRRRWTRASSWCWRGRSATTARCRGSSRIRCGRRGRCGGRLAGWRWR